MREKGEGTRERGKEVFVLEDKGVSLDRGGTDIAHVPHRQMVVY